MKKQLAEESEKTKKARQKLKKRWEDIDAKMTPQALERMSLEIHRWIARHAPHRVVLRTKAISLFDENKTTAKTSEKINKVAQSLKIEYLNDHCKT